VHNGQYAPMSYAQTYCAQKTPTPQSAATCPETPSSLVLY